MTVSQKVIAAVAIAAVLVSLLGVIALEVLRGGPDSVPQVVGLVSFIGILIGILATIFGVNTVVSQLNGHLQEHKEAAQQTTETAVAAAIQSAAKAAADVAVAHIQAQMPTQGGA
jgi:hypothetical protein